MTLSDTKSRWIAAADNKFGIDVLDIMAFSQSMMSTTADPEIAATFSQLRGSQGEACRGKKPANASSTVCDLVYPYDGQHADGALFTSPEMEFKWDIYLLESNIYFARSWTGQLIFVAHLRFETERVRVHEITYSSEQNDDPLYAIACVDFLIKSHVFRCLVPHPLPPDYPNHPDQIACFSFGQYGRMGRFASFGDTTSIKLPASTGNL